MMTVQFLWKIINMAVVRKAFGPTDTFYQPPLGVMLRQQCSTQYRFNGYDCNAATAMSVWD